MPRVEGRGAAAENLEGIDIEELGIEGEGPEQAFGGGLGGGAEAGEGGVVWGDLVVAGVGRIVEI